MDMFEEEQKQQRIRKILNNSWKQQHKPALSQPGPLASATHSFNQSVFNTNNNTRPSQARPGRKDRQTI